MLLLCVRVSLIGVLKALSGAFMSGEVIFFSVVLGTGTMGVGSEAMSSPVVRVCASLRPSRAR